MFEGRCIVDRDRHLEMRFGADESSARMLESAQVQVQARAHEIPCPGALRAVPPGRLERQLVPSRLDLCPEARLVGVLGVLQRGMDDGPELPAVTPPGSPPRSPITQFSSHSSSMCSLDGDTRMSSRVRSRSGPLDVGPATPYHSSGAAPGTPASASTASWAADRAALAAGTGAVRARRCCATSPRSESGCRLPLGVGQQLEEHAGAGVVVIDGGRRDEPRRPGERADEKPKLVVHRRPAAVEGVRVVAVGAGRGRSAATCREGRRGGGCSARCRPVLPRPPPCRTRARAMPRVSGCAHHIVGHRGVQAVFRHIGVEDAAHEHPRIGVERPLDESLGRLEQSHDGVEVAVGLFPPAGHGPAREPPSFARAHCAPTRSRAVRAPSHPAAAHRGGCRACVPARRPGAPHACRAGRTRAAGASRKAGVAPGRLGRPLRLLKRGMPEGRAQPPQLDRVEATTVPTSASHTSSNPRPRDPRAR